jgi:tetratricopeptide (TPR) repeat protein
MGQGLWGPPAGPAPGSREKPEAELTPEERAAREALRQLAALSPDQAEDLALELLEAVRSGDLPFGALLGYSEDDVYDIYRRAHVLQAAGRPKNAMVLCEGLLALSPGHPAVMMLLAACLMDLKEWAKALEWLEQVLSVAPEDAEALLKRGVVLLRMKRAVEAGLAFQKVLDLDPERATDEAQVAQRLLEALHASFGG